MTSFVYTYSSSEKKKKQANSPTEYRVKICMVHSSHAHFTLCEHEQWPFSNLQAMLVPVQDTTASLVISIPNGSYPNVTSADLLPFCQLIRDKFGHVKHATIQIGTGASYGPRDGDEHLMASLLQHLPGHQITKLTLSVTKVKYSPALGLLGESYPRLQELHVTTVWSTHAVNIFTKSIQQILSPDNNPQSTLRRLHMVDKSNYNSIRPRLQADDFQPLFQALSKNPNLERFSIAAIYRGEDEEPIVFDNECLDRIHYNAMICRGEHYGKLPEDPRNVSLNQFVEALIQVSDRMDCLYYFLDPHQSGITPDIYAKAGMEAAKKAQREMNK